MRYLVEYTDCNGVTKKTIVNVGLKDGENLLPLIVKAQDRWMAEIVSVKREA